MIPVKVVQVSLSNMGFVVLLREIKGDRALPVFIGAPEAQSIAFCLDKIQVPRPMTHDLFKQVLDNLECRMQRAEIHALRENTFFGRLILEANGLESEIDARPSDAIALALRCAVPILVAPEVMDVAGVIMTEGQPPDAAGTHAHQTTSRAEQIKKQISRAVEEERYEDAARLRDELKRITNTN